MPRKNKDKTVPFHQVKAGQSVRYNGQAILKIGPKKAMTAKGQILCIPDATLVTL
jgi:hypothetical protein